MKILILSFYFKPDLCAGSFRTTALVDSMLLEDQKIKIDVLTTMPNRYSSYTAEAEEFERDERINIFRIELPSHKSGMLDQAKSFLRFYLEVLRIVKDRKYDLIFATSSRLFTAFLGARISRRLRVPLYLDIRDIFIDTINDVLNNRLYKPLILVIKIIEKYTFSRVQKVNLVSRGFLSYFEERFNSLNYDFFTNGIDDEFLLGTKRYAELSSEQSTKKKVILYAGNIGEGQGLHRVVPKLALKVGDDFMIRVIGDGGRRKALENAVENLNNVELLPPMTRENLTKEYVNADVLFLHLNDYSAFEKVLPSKVFEYAAIGKPILAGVSGYAATFINENISNAGVFYPCDEVAAIQQLSKLNFCNVDRANFVEKYRRKSIMKNMANSIISEVK
ncbi:glycosyltransferase family 4 protein [Pleionea sediminis]|uniref:glycosyltransferase family 4 protein n=1 Tax=Pleionea sediminis TaxID=2569479 RepID=UPI0011865F4A|nr:glycosyltransferase family 4 protein [Pleionea sediminis]